MKINKKYLFIAILFFTVLILDVINYNKYSSYEKDIKYFSINEHMYANGFGFKISNPSVYSRDTINKYIFINKDDKLNFYNTNYDYKYFLTVDIVLDEDIKYVNLSTSMLFNDKKNLVFSSHQRVKNGFFRQIYFFKDEDFKSLKNGDIFISNIGKMQKPNTKMANDNSLTLVDETGDKLVCKFEYSDLKLNLR